MEPVVPPGLTNSDLRNKGYFGLEKSLAVVRHVLQLAGPEADWLVLVDDDTVLRYSGLLSDYTAEHSQHTVFCSVAGIQRMLNCYNEDTQPVMIGTNIINKYYYGISKC